MSLPSHSTESLIERATANQHRAHAPYSRFRAGAVVVDDAGALHDGAIVENISLGLSMCAERVALFRTATEGDVPSVLVLVAPRTGDRPTWPCGACLQVALELGGPDVEIIVASSEGDSVGEPLRSTVGELLPRGPRRSS